MTEETQREHPHDDTAETTTGDAGRRTARAGAPARARAGDRAPATRNDPSPAAPRQEPTGAPAPGAGRRGEEAPAHPSQRPCTPPGKSQHLGADAKTGLCDTVQATLDAPREVRRRRRNPDNPARGRRVPRLRKSLHHIERLTCNAATRDALLALLPAAADDPVLLRYAVFALWTTWLDRETGLRVIGQPELEWIGGKPFGGSYWGQNVIALIEDRLPAFTWKEYELGGRCRLIETDGLPEALHAAVRADLSLGVEDFECRVGVLSGRPHDKNEATRLRAETLAACDAMTPPSPTSRWIQRALNHRPANVSSRVLRQVAEARAYVEQMEIGVDLKRQNGETAEAMAARKAEVRDAVRGAYLASLRAIEEQHQPFYQFSGRGRTDRVFGHNPGALSLPADVRRILYRGFLSVDLKSAHLYLAAALWGVDDVLETLKREDYSVWTDLLVHLDLGHLAPGTADYAEAKDALKRATYSVIYGMKESSVVWTFSRAAHRLVGPGAGTRLAGHWLIRRLLDARDEHLAALTDGTVLETPTGIRVVVGGDVDARSAMATLAQAYEQQLMSVVLEHERDHHETANPPSFHVALWIHDGCYVAISRSERKHVREISNRLARRAEELGVYARFEVETIGGPADSAEAPGR